MEPRFPAFIQLTGAKKIGAGGSGLAYAARHPQWGDVAVKVANDTSEENRQLFVSEYTLLRSLQHRAILRAFAFFTIAERQSAIVTQFCASGDLYTFADRLPLAQRFSSLAGILAALDYLHALGIVHRDLKGENILVHAAEGPKLSDLGLAASRHAGNRERGGTLEYMAPEIIDNRGARIESDIYSLGVILFRLATGKLPFAADDPLQVIAQKQTFSEQQTTGLELTISPRFARLVQQCLAPNPEDRPKSIRDVSESLALDRLLDRNECDNRPIAGFLHHHFYSYLSGFCRQELSESSGELTIAHHHQEPGAGLTDVISDFLCMAGFNLLASSENELQFTRGEVNFRVCLTGELKTNPGLELSEIDDFALEAILGKIFTREIEPLTLQKMKRLTNGNLALMRLVLLDWESRGWIDIKSARLNCDPVQLFNYQPDSAYLERVATMLPPGLQLDSPSELLIAADPGMYPLDHLIDFGKLTESDLELDIKRGWVDDKTYRTHRGYFSEYVYRTASSELRRLYHLDWIKIVQDSDELEPSIRERLLFHHFAGAGDDTNALVAAVALARILQSEQQTEEAIALLLQARSLSGATRDLTRYVELLILQADLHKSVGDLNRALSCYSAVIRYGRRINDRAAVANAFKRLGDIYKGKRDYRRGSRALDHAVRYFGEIGDELELSHCFNNIGNICWIAGDLEGAEVNYETALEVQKRLGALKDTASTLNNLGTVKYLRGQFDEGIRLYKESVEIKKEINDLPELARTYNNLSAAYFEQDELHLSQEYLKQAFDINRRLGAEDELMYNFENFCEIEMRRGNFAETRGWAIEGLKRAKRDAHASRGILICHLANVAILQGRYDKAASLIAAARSREQQITDLMLTVILSVITGDYHRVLLDPVPALEAYSVAIENGRKLSYARSVAACLIRRAQMEMAIARPEPEIAATLAEAEQVLAGVSVKREKLELLLETAAFHLAGGRLEACEETIGRAVAFADFDGSAVLRARLSLLRGRVELIRGNAAKALTLLNDAVTGAKTLGTPESVWPSLMALGDCYREKHDFEKALKCFIEAFSIIRESAQFIPQKSLRTRYLSDPSKRALAERLEEMSALVA